jgi:hypothetical protein
MATAYFVSWGLVGRYTLYAAKDGLYLEDRCIPWREIIEIRVIRAGRPTTIQLQHADSGYWVGALSGYFAASIERVLREASDGVPKVKVIPHMSWSRRQPKPTGTSGRG